MPVELAPATAKPEDIASGFQDQFVPLNSQFSYFCTPSMAEEDLRHYLQEPLSALPAAVCERLPHVALVLVPFLERLNAKSGIRVSFEGIPEESQEPNHRVETAGGAVLFFAVKDEEISDFHHAFYSEIAALVGRNLSKEVRDDFFGVVRNELAAKVHGEVDEKSWRLKQALPRRHESRDSKAFKEYARQAFEDTLTLYLHGICCDIDVESGPRQMPSRSVRKRLESLHQLFPPPAGHAVFPEELKRK